MASAIEKYLALLTVTPNSSLDKSKLEGDEEGNREDEGDDSNDQFERKNERGTSKKFDKKNEESKFEGWYLAIKFN